MRPAPGSPASLGARIPLRHVPARCELGDPALLIGSRTSSFERTWPQKSTHGQVAADAYKARHGCLDTRGIRIDVVEANACQIFITNTHPRATAAAIMQITARLASRNLRRAMIEFAQICSATCASSSSRSRTSSASCC